MKVRLFIILTAILITNDVLGQGSFKVGYRLDYERSKMQGRDLNRFFTSYNSYYGANMTVSLDTLQSTATSHLNHGFSIRFMGEQKVAFCMGFEMFFGSSAIQRKGQFANGITTQCDMQFRDITFQTDLGVKVGPIVLAGVMAGRVRNTEFALGYLYQDGTYSIGNEYDILSIYQSMHTTLDLGYSIGFKAKRFFISIQRTRPTNFASDDGLLTLVDADERQMRWSDLPTDFGKWVNSPTQIDPNNDLVKARSLMTARTIFSVEFLIFGK